MRIHILEQQHLSQGYSRLCFGTVTFWGWQDDIAVIQGKPEESSWSFKSTVEVLSYVALAEWPGEASLFDISFKVCLRITGLSEGWWPARSIFYHNNKSERWIWWEMLGRNKHRKQTHEQQHMFWIVFCFGHFLVEWLTIQTPGFLLGVVWVGSAVGVFFGSGCLGEL